MDLLGLMKNRFCGLLIAGWFSPWDGGLGLRVHDTDRSIVLEGVMYSSSMPESFDTREFFGVWILGLDWWAKKGARASQIFWIIAKWVFLLGHLGKSLSSYLCIRPGSDLAEILITCFCPVEISEVFYAGGNEFPGILLVTRSHHQVGEKLERWYEFLKSWPHCRATIPATEH